MKKYVLLPMVSLLMLSCQSKKAQETNVTDSDVDINVSSKIKLSSKDSLALSELENLYDELQMFKSEKKFSEYGFAPGGPYKTWYDKVVNLRDKETREFYLVCEIGAGDLLSLGMEYYDSKGQETETSESFKRRFEYAFNPYDQDDGEEIGSTKNDLKETIGKWHVENKFFPNDKGYTIELFKQGEQFFSIENGKKNKLKKSDDKYIVVGDLDHTYYVIIDGNLHFYGLDGDYTEASGYVITPIK